MNDEPSIFRPVDIGEKGRRAVVYVCTDGITIAATDRDTAGHAMSVVFEALNKTERPAAADLLERATQLMTGIPEQPHAELTELANGNEMQQDRLIAYGYVRPVGNAHECGGATFNQRDHSVTPIAPQQVYLLTTTAH